MTHKVNMTDLEYADDMSLVSSSWDNLTAMGVVTVLNHYCSHLGLKISCKKTKILAVCQHTYQEPEFVVLCDDDVPINVVDTFQYLGSIMSDDCTTDCEITH